jgi:hypothetical protein
MREESFDIHTHIQIHTYIHTYIYWGHDTCEQREESFDKMVVETPQMIQSFAKVNSIKFMYTR